MTAITRGVGLGIALLAMTLSVTLQGQQTSTTTREPGTATVTTTQMTGMVMYVEGNKLVVKMSPQGEIRSFNVPPSAQFMIDGQPKTVSALKHGTMLYATVTTTTQPITVRTVASLTGTVWYVNQNTVILTHENGENKTYTVEDAFRFMVNGQPQSVRELRKGMKVTATKITAQPTDEISTSTVVKGFEP